MRKPLVRIIVANYFLFNTIAQLAAIALGYLSGGLGTSGPVPHSPYPLALQWLWVIGTGLTQAGLSFAIRFHEPKLVLAMFCMVVLNLTVGMLATSVPATAALLCMVRIVVEAAAVAAVLRVQLPRELPWKRAHKISFRELIGLCLIWVCAALMLADLMAVFIGAANPVVSSTSTAGASTILSLILLVIAGAISGRPAWAAWQAGTMLASLATYYVAYCMWSFLYVDVAYPQRWWNYHWDASFVWLAILASVGCWYLSASERWSADSL